MNSAPFGHKDQAFERHEYEEWIPPTLPLDQIIQDPDPILKLLEKYREFLYHTYKTVISHDRWYEAEILTEAAGRINATHALCVSHFDAHVTAAHDQHAAEANFRYAQAERERDIVIGYVKERVKLIDISERCYCDGCKPKHDAKDKWQMSWGLTMADGDPYKAPRNAQRGAHNAGDTDSYKILPRQHQNKHGVFTMRLHQRTYQMALENKRPQEEVDRTNAVEELEAMVAIAKDIKSKIELVNFEEDEGWTKIAPNLVLFCGLIFSITNQRKRELSGHPFAPDYDDDEEEDEEDDETLDGMEEPEIDDTPAPLRKKPTEQTDMALDSLMNKNKQPAKQSNSKSCVIS